jgi:two-component system, LytTR family, response regulator
MISSIIIDDELKSIDTLKKLVEQFCTGITVDGTASSVDEAAKLVTIKKPDLIFLDIEMPGKNAFDLLSELQPLKFEVVFVSAFDKYAIQAFKYSAIDYLLKPVSIDELIITVEKVRTRIQEKNMNWRLENYFNYKQNSDSKIAIQTKEGYIFCSPKEIVYCGADGAYTWIFLSNGEKILSSVNLKEFEDILPGDMFCRIHHSFLININFASKYIKGRGGHVELSNGVILEVSQRKKDDFLTHFNKSE